MALTHDEIIEILGLYARGYSGRKIAAMKGYSEVTIYGHVRLAKKRVFQLKETSMEAEQIAVRLDYPLTFVTLVLEEYEGKQREVPEAESETETELETEMEPEVEAEVDTKVEIEVNEASKKLDVRKDWENFQKDSEIEKRKTKLRSYAKNDLVFLSESVIEYKNKGVFDQTYDDRQKMFRHEIEDFVLKYIDEVDTIEAISELEGVLEKITENLVSMIEVYGNKA